MSKDEGVESTGERVYLTKDNDDTYDSEVIEWFIDNVAENPRF
jgi:hypothetical protein